MNGHEQLEVLRSIEILVDTREQPTKRAMKRYERFGCPHRRCTLSYGDYSYNATLPDGSSLYNTEETVSPGCVIERARENGARIYLIVENASWENLLNGKYRTKMDAKAYTASVIAFMVRYNLNIIFCKEETSGDLIKEILYRDLKERLERGEFG